MKSIWETLYEEKLVEGKEPIADKLSSPWYVKILLAFSGWLAAIFIFGFLAVGFNGLLENEIALILVGSMLILSAYAILKKEVNDFVEHLGLAISVAGQIMIVLGLFGIMQEQTIIMWLIITLIQISLTMLIPNYIHRFFSSFFGVYAFSLVLLSLGMPHSFAPLVMLLIAYLWLNEFHFKNIEKAQAIGYGLIIAFLFIESSMLLHQSHFFWSISSHTIPLWFSPWLGKLLAGMVTLYVVLTLLKTSKQDLTTRLSLVIVISILILSFISIKVPALMTGILIMILGFNHSNRILLGLGIMSFLFSISSYYYFLNITLLEKSVILAILGGVLLLGRWFIFHILLKEKAIKNV